ncbi:MAG TPA: response regulator transcription factor [Fimbriimonadales bacterium]|nr:response regulator transcription factor [Fimbriimonadales bacterium]
MKPHEKRVLLPEKTTIAIADQHLSAELISRALEQEGYEVTTILTRPDELKAFIEKPKSHLLILDAEFLKKMEDRSGGASKKAFEKQRLLFLADKPDDLFPLLSHEHAPVVFRTQSSKVLLEAVKTIALGKQWRQPILVRKEQRRRRGIALSPRENEIADHIAKGASNRDIAQELNLSEQSIKNIVSKILKKLGLTNRVQIALWKLGLLDE